jgi:hypothetical protein
MGQSVSIKRRLGAWLAGGAATVIAVAAAPAEELQSQIARAVQALRDQSPGSDASTQLDRAEAAIRADGPWVALDLFATARGIHGAAQFKAAHDAGGGLTFEELRTTLGRRSGELLDRIRARHDASPRPAVVQGWIDLALARGNTYYDSAVGFAASGQTTGPKEYLYGSLQRLEKALALLEFEYETGPGEPTALPGLPGLPELPGLDAARTRLEADLLKRFTGTTPDNRYPPTVVANASLDFSHKLDDAGHHLASAISYLDAVRTLYSFDQAGKAPENVDALLAEVPAWRRRIDAAAGDQSIAQAMLQRAVFNLARPTMEPAPAHAIAQAALRAALPAYFELLGGPSPADEHARSTAPISTVTILRYPYT